MTPLKTLRHDLGDILAAGLGAAHAKLGAQVNPNAVQIQPGEPYVAVLDYTKDTVTFEATVTGKPGDPAAVADALDDIIDQIRATLKAESPTGNQYSFREVSRFVSVTVGEAVVPGVVVTVVHERQT